ncbi:Transposase DDE domain-containing protein [Bradyrhizobium shewense]|uniref:Transposase DDE domain-containing protein n=2 Tax=Bradyrhizobium shewense TaxID=1761772 RepID=A0A1C3WFN1_9BRAD|nr:Transposase DDE domain-containing protein [Bradyrhizobium shewense]
MGRAELELPAKSGRRRRIAQLEIRFMSAQLARPKNGLRANWPESVAVNVIDVRQTNPPAGEAPIHWRLLTTHAITSETEAWATVDLYRQRWAIEQLFRTLKTAGFDIERVQIEDKAPRDRLITATLIAAVRIQQLVHARDGGPGPLRPLSDAFEPEDISLLEACCADLEGKTERQKNPHPKGSLARAAWVCARLGGWTGYYGKPGPVVMLEGWLEFQALKRGTNLMMPHRQDQSDV